MKIYYDNIVFYLQKAGGVSNYWFELVRRALMNKANCLFIEQRSRSQNIFARKLRTDETRCIRDGALPLGWQRYLPFPKKIEPFSIFHSSYYRVSSQKNVLNVVTVYDFVYEYFCRGLKKTIHHAQKAYALKKADGIICISENTKRDLLRLFPDIEEEMIAVIPLAANEYFFPLNKVADEVADSFPFLKKKYILFVGGRSPYKHFHAAVEVLSLLGDYMLVVVGGGGLNKKEIRYLDDSLGQRYYYVQEASQEGLNHLYNFAFCLLYPSSYEGFGLPVLEALKSGCPVIAINASSIPEVCGKAAIMLDDVHVDGFVNAIRKLERKEFRDDIIRSGFLQAADFSWDKAYEQTVKFYDAMAQKKWGVAPRSEG